MHATAFSTGRNFFKTYVDPDTTPRVVEIGSQNVNGSLRDVAPSNIKEYVGLDFAHGAGVDIVLEDPYKFPLENDSFDILVTSSCFEHSEMFWLSFLEGMRVLKDTGVMYINIPSAWESYHRYPVDCWRFWPDASKGLESWANYNNIPSMVLESYVTPPPGNGIYTADYVCVFLKNRLHADKHKRRMIDELTPYEGFFNGFRFPSTEKFPHGWHTPTAFLKQDLPPYK